MLAEVEALLFLGPSSTRRPMVASMTLPMMKLTTKENDEHDRPRRRSGRTSSAAPPPRNTPSLTTAALIGAVGEEAEQDRADEAADEVDGDDVEAVVELERAS